MHDAPLAATNQVRGDFAQPQLFCRRQQLSLAQLAHRREPWELNSTSKPAPLAACRCDEIGFDAFERVFRQCATEAERFIVGMGQDS